MTDIIKKEDPFDLVRENVYRAIEVTDTVDHEKYKEAAVKEGVTKIVQALNLTPAASNAIVEKIKTSTIGIIFMPQITFVKEIRQSLMRVVRSLDKVQRQDNNCIIEYKENMIKDFADKKTHIQVARRQFDQMYYKEAYRRCNFDLNKTAQFLGMTYQNLCRQFPPAARREVDRRK